MIKSSYSQDFVTLSNNTKLKVSNPVSIVEKVLLSKLKSGDSSAFADIFSAYYQDLVLFAFRFTNDLNSAEEIVQDTFVKIWEEHESINITVSLKSYILKIVQNNFIDSFRHSKIVQDHNNFVLKNSSLYENDTDSYLLHSELQELIDAALKKLPENVAEAFRMNRYKGLKYREIADLLGVSERTIEVRIGKALQMLRNYLKDYY